MPVAFAGIAVEVSAESVTIEGRPAGTPAVPPTGSGSESLPQTSMSLDGVQFIEGQRYLLTATDETVSGGGFSGPATPGLEQTFAEAFGG